MGSGEWEGSGEWKMTSVSHSPLPIPYYPFPIPYSLFPIPYSLLPIPYSLFPTPYSLFPIPHSPSSLSSKPVFSPLYSNPLFVFSVDSAISIQRYPKASTQLQKTPLRQEPRDAKFWFL